MKADDFGGVSRPARKTCQDPEHQLFRVRHWFDSRNKVGERVPFTPFDLIFWIYRAKTVAQGLRGRAPFLFASGAGQLNYDVGVEIWRPTSRRKPKTINPGAARRPKKLQASRRHIRDAVHDRGFKAGLWHG